jgi:hypothetical protein
MAEFTFTMQPGRRSAIRSAALALLLLPLTQPPASAITRTTRSFPVAATVQPYATLAASQPAQLVISKDDLRLGYVDVPGISNPTRASYTVTTNDRAGYALQFGVSATMAPLLTAIQISGIGANFSLAPTGGRTTLAYSANKVTFTPTIRFQLSNKAKAGSYAWPLAVAVQPN